jgi:hypothetical protein
VHKLTNSFLLTFLLQAPLSSHPRKPPLLHLRQRFRPTHKRNSRHRSRDWQGLEQIPAGVIQEEHSLHGQNAPEEQRMADWCRAQGLAQMVDIGAQCKPADEERRHTCHHGSEKDKGYYLGRRAGIGAEDVVDLREGPVTQGFLCLRAWNTGAEDNAKVESWGFVRRGGAEVGDYDRGFQRRRDGKERGGNVVVILKTRKPA